MSEDIMAAVHCLARSDEQGFQGAFHEDWSAKWFLLNWQKIAIVISVSRKQSAARQDSPTHSFSPLKEPNPFIYENMKHATQL